MSNNLSIFPASESVAVFVSACGDGVEFVSVCPLDRTVEKTIIEKMSTAAQRIVVWGFMATMGNEGLDRIPISPGLALLPCVY
jgi:hypothetical protein